MAYHSLRFEVEDGVAQVTVNRPEKYNALNRQVIAELEQCVGEVERDPGVRAVIVTGAGEKAFVAGADINELAALESNKKTADRRQKAEVRSQNAVAEAAPPDSCLLTPYDSL